MESCTFDQAIAKIAEVVAWEPMPGDGYVDSKGTQKTINVVKLIYPESAHLVETALYQQVELRKSEPAHDAELTDHLIHEFQQEAMRDAP